MCSRSITRAARSPRLAAAIAIAGIVFGSGGCGSSAKVEAKSTTVGQELQDLDAARNKGLLTEAEYQSQRAQIMKRK